MPDLFEPSYRDYSGKRIKKYRNFLARAFRGDARGVEQMNRADLFGAMGAREAESRRQADAGLSRAFGMNTPTGLSASLSQRAGLASDYGGANLLASESARRTKLQHGSALESSKQRQANWYLSLIQPVIQQQMIEDQIAAMQEQADSAKKAALIGAAGSVGGGLLSLLKPGP